MKKIITPSPLYKTPLVAEAWKLIQKASSITLLTHAKPDADGMSACAAIALLLKKTNKQIEVVYPTKPDAPFKRQQANTLINQHKQVPDLIISFDTANYDRLYYPEAFKNIPHINIDHHISNSITGTYNIIDAAASSTCEVLYLLLQEWDAASIDRAIAELLLVGIIYDSQMFITQSTSAQTLHIAATLLDFGSNLYELKNELSASHSVESLRFWGTALSTLTVSANKNAAWVSVTQQKLTAAGVTTAALDGFSNFLWNQTPFDITILFTEREDGGTRVSLRAKRSDVNALAKQFGGGGHTFAAGITSKEPLSVLRDKIVKLL